MATKLGLFNAALLDLGHVRMSDTGEPIEAGRLLNDVYMRVVNSCLNEADWNFAMETIQADADTGVEPVFGYSEVFGKPTDWVRTIAVSLDPYFTYPEVNYYDDSNFWSAENSPIYIRYVSSDTGLGWDLSRWPEEFTRYVELKLADRVGYRITEDKYRLEALKIELKKQGVKAKNIDAMNEPNPKFAPPGSWVSSRWGRQSRGDRGKRNSFTG